MSIILDFPPSIVQVLSDVEDAGEGDGAEAADHGELLDDVQPRPEDGVPTPVVVDPLAHLERDA